MSVSLSYRFTLNANFREANKENQIKDTNNNKKKDTKRRSTETVKTRNKERTTHIQD